MMMEFKKVGPDGRGRRWDPHKGLGADDPSMYGRTMLVIDGKVWDGREMNGRKLNEMLKGRNPDTDPNIQKRYIAPEGKSVRSAPRANVDTAKSTPTAAPARDVFSVYEITPQGQWQGWRMKHHTEDLVQYLASDLGLKFLPRVRWFIDPVRGAKSEPGWKVWDLHGRGLPWGFFDSHAREVWVKDGLSYNDERYVLAHELRHAWQIDTYGPAYFNEHWDGMEADANAFGEKYR